MFGPMPPATRAILIANILVFLLQQVASNLMDVYFALWPLGQYFMPWQVITYAFLHANLMHIFFNMLALVMFGGSLERFLGSKRYLIYYFACVLAAAGTQLAVQAATGSMEQTIGASGGIFGLLLAFAIFFPKARILVYFAIPMPAWLFVGIYGLIELFMGVAGKQDSVAHFAHLGGMLGGAILLLYWRSVGSLRY